MKLGDRKGFLHLSHSDVRSDARILKEVSALKESFPNHRVTVIGIAKARDVASADIEFGIQVQAMRLACGRAKWVGRHLRRALCLIELTLRMIVIGVRLRPEIVHSHDTVALPAAWVISALTGSRLVYDAHELESDCNPLMPSIGRLALFAERWCWKRISLLISVSPSIIEWYQENLGPKRTVLVLNSPLISSLAGEEVQGVRRAFGSPGYFHSRFGIPAGVPVFIFVGYFSRARAIETVLRVFRRGILRSHIVFMGSGDEVGVAAHAERFPNIHSHPSVPREQVVKFVREADCGICLREGKLLSGRLSLPNKLFEYAFAGVPVLASRLPEMERLVSEYGLGLCCDNDADSIEAAVRKIEQEGLAPPTADLTELSWDTQAKRLQEAYRQLLLDGGAAVPDKQGDR